MKGWNSASTVERRSLKTHLSCSDLKCNHFSDIRLRSSSPIFMATVPHKSQGSPRRGSHDATASVHGHPAAATALRGVVIHAKIVSQLVCQRHSCTQRVLRVILWWGGGNMRTCKSLKRKYTVCESLFTLCENKPQSAAKTYKEKILRFPNSCRFPKQFCSAPSSVLYCPISFWKPEFICHSITPADPIRTAVRGDEPPYTHRCLTSKAGAYYYGRNISVSSKFKTE